jgi:pyruvate, orthophosphate dikinase
VKLKSLGMPVPPGFIITTEVFRCRSLVEGYPRVVDNFKEQVSRQIKVLEQLTGKTFGDPLNPLLFSVRSGAAISQPGMMDTFLNVGISEEIATGIASKTGNQWFAWDCYRRFLQCYGMFYGMVRDDFDAIIGEHKQRHGIAVKRGLSGQSMREVALAYKRLILGNKIEITDDPYEQLYMTIWNVFNSWHSAKAKTYRRIMGISDDWGTAATVQEMVFGNVSKLSGSGVIFTHNPRWSGDILKLWGDFTIGNQGEDVVSGLVTTQPISEFQQEIERRDTKITLESHFPKIYKALKEVANELIYKRDWTPQELEFTFESPEPRDLFILQTRDMTMRERKEELAFDLEGIDTEQYLGRGIGVTGGAISGRVVFTVEEIDSWRDTEPDILLILARRDTVPDDIREIYASDGLLTARGGLTSHAAVVAHRLEKTCVVGCESLVCDEIKKECLINNVVIRSGDFISIDGQGGAIYRGRMPVKEA